MGPNECELDEDSKNLKITIIKMFKELRKYINRFLNELKENKKMN